MKKEVFGRRAMTALCLIILVGVIGVLGAGCSSSVKDRRSEAPRTEGAEMKPLGAKYYSFDDVLVPSELNYQQKRSFVYETPKFKTGILIFTKWWLDGNSLLDFFTYHMEKDNWKMVNSFKGEESILNFSKPDKTCAIKVKEKWYGVTEVEIRVGPLGEKM
jgi:hypothetical protein